LLSRNGEESPDLTHLMKLLTKVGLSSVPPDWTSNEMKMELVRRLKLSNRHDEQSSFKALDIALALLLEFERQIEAEK